MQRVIYSGEDFFGHPNKVTPIITTISTSLKVTLDDLLPIVEEFIYQTEASLTEQCRHPLFYWGHFAALQERGAIAIQATMYDFDHNKPYWFGGKRLPLLGRVIARPRKIVVEHFQHSDLSDATLSLAGAPTSEFMGKFPWRMPYVNGERGLMPKEMSDEIYEELSGNGFMSSLIDYIRAEIESDRTTQAQEQGGTQSKPSHTVKPKQGAPVSEWLAYYHAEKRLNFKITFPMIAEFSGYSVGTFKNAHEGCQEDICQRRKRKM